MSCISAVRGRSSHKGKRMNVWCLLVSKQVFNSLSLDHLLQFVTSVVSCSPAELKLDHSGKKEKVKGFNVILKDTVLFPEGGGQVTISVH